MKRILESFGILASYFGASYSASAPGVIKRLALLTKVGSAAMSYYELSKMAIVFTMQPKTEKPEVLPRRETTETTAAAIICQALC